MKMLIRDLRFVHRHVAALLAFVWAVGFFVAGAKADNIEFFEKKIRPLLVEQCYKCHSIAAGKSKGELLLDSRDNLLKGGENGPSIVPGDPDKSRLIEAVRYTNPDLQMPPKGQRLSPEQVADLVAWVKMGAPDPRTGQPAVSLAGSYDYAAARKLWAFTPPKDPAIPQVQRSDWLKSPIDRFILSKLESAGLSPAPPADKRTLIRRANYDLTGLPPTPQEVEAFVADNSPDAFAKLVDRLLASPAYGERWARHWLDVVRYTDSFDSRAVAGGQDITAAWRYRDWVVKAFNNDLPYNQFVADQIAGDLLPKQGPDDFDGLVATGVYVMGNWPGGDADRKKMLTDVVDDQVDLTGRAFMGLTLACARCHDHKFDPIPTADYYSLAGIFFSSHFLPDPGSPTAGGPLLRIPLINATEQEKIRQRESRIAELQKQLENQTADAYQKLIDTNLAGADRYLAAAWDLSRAPTGTKLETIASTHQVEPRLLSRWGNYLRPYTHARLPLAARTMLTRIVHRSDGIDGLDNWTCPDGRPCPNAAFNRTSREIAHTTITLPPHCVAVHPGPSSGVAVGWKSPITGVVQISGRVVDADAHCGNGIAWRMSRLVAASEQYLAAGQFNNGGVQDFSTGDGGMALQSVSVQAGQTIQLAVYPKGEYSCDSTVVEWEIAQTGDEKHRWQLAADMLDGPIDDERSNPHADRLGNSDVWSFYEVPDLSIAEMVAPDRALQRFADAASMSPSDTAQLRQSAAAVRDALAAEQRRAVELQRAGKPLTDLSGDEANLYLALADSKSAFWTNRDENELPAADREGIKSARSQIEAIKKEAKEAPYCHALQEGGCPSSIYEGIHDAKIHVRGRYDRQTTQVPRRFPRILAGDDQTPITQGSGRLQLAEWITRPEHPLVARVMANRLWQHHFGEGIVRTPNNYGKLGVPPTHPELLDYLALQFIRSGWSIKTMQRQIMLTAAYQQSSEPDPATYKADPDNLLFGHVNRQRLEAEALRDSLLADTDSLDRTIGGPAIRELDNPRRTLYLMTVRSERSDYRTLFDAADPTGIADKRIDSTVAPQALFLMNNPFALKKTAALADLVMKQGPADESGKIDWLYRRLFSRPPQPDEIGIGQQLLEKARKEKFPSGNATVERLAWQEYCQVLLCSNEFVYID